ncbi:ATP-binding protein [uncultured Legionella sp.]|uniref:sensor histidine kinase n=1 Tax=uncultured Legionella sp. TaxID=210934 RepID=UPI00260438C8|nr:ATP-binding protein [uncultured Legionella sp.]
MDIHKLLIKQLERANCSVDSKPETDEQWLAFIKQVNNTYIEADQERYLHERSMEVSSREIARIHNEKVVEEKIRELNQQISTTARRAGMAEVAVTILHNIGNILNSSNVSITLLKNSFNQQYKQKLLRVFDMLLQHQNGLSEFLIKDPKGKLIPPYVLSLSKIILEDDAQNRNEIDNLTNDLKHISQIVDMQKSVSGLSNLKERVYLPDILDIALSMSVSNTNNEEICIIKEFDNCPLIEGDKSRLLQILVNIIQNARDAVLYNAPSSVKEIRLSINEIDSNTIQLLIKDNGEGINPDHLDRIFSFGFTTKVNGHGFGLHSASLSAREMGGALNAESSGEGLGATFILTLPIMRHSEHRGGSNA